MKTVIFEVDNKKWRAFKAWCVANDTTMKAQLDKLITEFLG